MMRLTKTQVGELMGAIATEAARAAAEQLEEGPVTIHGAPTSTAIERAIASGTAAGVLTALGKLRIVALPSECWTPEGGARTE